MYLMKTVFDEREVGKVQIRLHLLPLETIRSRFEMENPTTARVIPHLTRSAP